MPLQLEAFLPFVIVAGVLSIGTYVMDHTHRYFNNGKPARRLLDNWDKMLVRRDERLNGNTNIQYVR